MGGAVAKVVRKVTGAPKAAPKPKVAPRAAVVEPAKVNPNTAVGAGTDGAGDDDASASMLRRRRGTRTQTAMTAPGGDQSAAPVARKTLLGGYA